MNGQLQGQDAFLRESVADMRVTVERLHTGDTQRQYGKDRPPAPIQQDKS